MTDSQKTLLYRSLFFIVLLLAVYGNTLNHGFVWDDTDVIVDNPVLERLGNVPMFFLMEDRIETASGYYRPLTYASFALDRALWGLNPVGFNLTNLLLHIAAALSFYLVTAALFQKERLAFIAALLFALHPVAGETINFHSGGRNTLLCAVFFLLALLSHTKRKPVAGVLLFAGAIFSKEFGLVLPAFLYVYDRFIAHEKPSLKSYLPYLIPVALYFTLRSFAVEQGNLLQSLNFTESLWAAPLLLLRYLFSMVWPFGLKVLYDVHTNILVAVASLVGSLFLVAAIYLCYRKEQRELALAGFWYLLFLLPVINIIHLPAAALQADRYAYFSLMGFSLALSFLICKMRKEAGLALVLILCAVFALIDFRRNDHWKNDFNFYSRMIVDAPEMALGYHDLGIWYFKHDDLPKAEHYLALAAQKQDITPRLLGAGAGALWESGKLEGAEKLLLRQLQLDPTNPQPYIMLKMIYERRGNQELARSYAAKADRLFPGIEQMMSERVVTVTQQAESFMAQGAYSRATTMLLEALAINPDYVPAILDLGSVYAETGALERALKYMQRGVALAPANPSARYNLSMLYQMQGRQAEAAAEMAKFKELEAAAQGKGEREPGSGAAAAPPGAEATGAGR